MPSKHSKTSPFCGIVLIITMLLTACQGTQVTNSPTPPSPSVTAPSLSVSRIAPMPSPTQTATIEPLTLHIAEMVPMEVISQADLQEIQRGTEADATLWFGPQIEAPMGERLATSTWVYALAAPFPTLVDDITLVDLRAYWLGNPDSLTTSVTRLYVPEVLFQVLSDRWGASDPTLIEPYQQPPESQYLWESGAWTILPFDALDPKLKVIRVDGRSPLFKDFEPSTDPLTIAYQLVQNGQADVKDVDLQPILDAIQPGNRDPDKITTLVMTGVTALVRAIAYRMELNGVLYPGEKIRHWLIEADLTHISNEVSFYEDCPFPDPTSRRLLFCSDPKYIDLLDDVGADIIELTGNHNNDAMYMYGHDAVPFTLDLYEQYGMVYFGGGRDLGDAKSPLLVSHNGNQLAFIGCNAFGPDFAWATEDTGGAAPCEDYQWMADEIRRLRSEGYLPIATFQYYEDYYDFAEEHHIRDFGIMAEAGAVIVNGSQAHRPKAMAFEQDALIDYGLGNLFFDQRWTLDMYNNVIVQTSWEIIQRHTFYDGRHLSTELLTAMLEDYAQPRPMTPLEREIFLTELFDASGWDSR